MAAPGEPGDTGIAARFLVDRAGDLDRAGKVDCLVQQRLDGDAAGRQFALHVAVAAPPEAAVTDLPTEGIDGPADRKSVVQGKSVWGRVDAGGRRIIKQ